MLKMYFMLLRLHCHDIQALEIAVRGIIEFLLAKCTGSYLLKHCKLIERNQAGKKTSLCLSKYSSKEKTGPDYRPKRLFQSPSVYINLVERKNLNHGHY